MCIGVRQFIEWYNSIKTINIATPGESSFWYIGLVMETCVVAPEVLTFDQL